jgi:hypothetical protein
VEFLSRAKKWRCPIGLGGQDEHHPRHSMSLPGRVSPTYHGRKA